MVRFVVGVLLSVGALTLGLASAIHSGVPLLVQDPFAEAAVPEAILAFVLAVGAVSVWVATLQFVLGLRVPVHLTAHQHEPG